MITLGMLIAMLSAWVNKLTWHGCADTRSRFLQVHRKRRHLHRTNAQAAQPATAHASASATGRSAKAEAKAHSGHQPETGRQGADTEMWEVEIRADSGWANVWWPELVFSGATALGVQEWRTLQSALALPTYPFDYPGTAGYRCAFICVLRFNDELANCSRTASKNNASERNPFCPCAGAFRNRLGAMETSHKRDTRI